jgi:hypothetical protein
VEVRVAGEVRRLRVEAGASSARLAGLKIAKGDAVLVAQAVGSPGVEDPPHVVLHATGKSD